MAEELLTGRCDRCRVDESARPYGTHGTFRRSSDPQVRGVMLHWFMVPSEACEVGLLTGHGAVPEENKNVD